MHCKFLKLTNGEDLIVQTDDACDTFNGKEFISVIDPVLIASMRIPRGTMIIETYIMQPWIKMAKSDVVQIPTKNIVVAVNVHEMAEKQYLEYVEETNCNKLLENNTNLSDREEDSEEIISEELNFSGDESEENDNDIPNRTRFGRTIH